jgi:predicted alpha/beta-fold hydrolase
MIAYQPSRWLAGGHRMTFYAAMRRRRFLDVPPSDERYFETARDARVLARCHWQSERRDHPTLVLLHGLEGSANAHYMRGIAGKAFKGGFNSVRLNQRNCGRTEHLSVGLYHSGLIEDPAAVIRELVEVDGLRSIAVAGYSLGGNIALRLAGVYGESPPRELHSISAVSPPLDLARAANAIEWKQNWFYQWHFMRDLRRRLRLKARLFPDVYTADGLDRIRTIRQFDERYTAPLNGFRDAADYYHRASALRVIDRIRVPTLIITAEDDPFIPVASFREPPVSTNPHLSVVITRRGGHCGFIAPRDGDDDDGYWAEGRIVDFAYRCSSSTSRSAS